MKFSSSSALSVLDSPRPPAEHVLGWTERGRNKQHPPPKSGHQPTKYSPIRRDTIRTCKYIFRFPRLFLFYFCIWNKYLVYIYFLNLFLLRLFYFCIGINVWCIYFILVLLLYCNWDKYLVYIILILFLYYIWNKYLMYIYILSLFYSCTVLGINIWYIYIFLNFHVYFASVLGQMSGIYILFLFYFCIVTWINI